MANNFESLPIGVFDSGIGGLNVLKSLYLNFENENFVYLGDNKNAPYGNKSLKKVKQLSTQSIQRLIDYGVKAIVIACNTVSTNFYKYLKSKYTLPIIPTVPPIIVDDNAVLACTTNTAKSTFVKTYYKGRVLAFSSLAKTIENNIFNLDKVNVKKIFSKLNKDTDTLILGCTHYSFLQQKIERELRVKCIDGYNLISNALKKSVNLNEPVRLVSKNRIDFIGNHNEFNREIFNKLLL